jgi:STE24 endopeptidase
MAAILFYVIIAIIIANYLLDRYLSFLNKTHWIDSLPAELADVYSEEKFQQSITFRKESYCFSIISESFSFLILLLFLLLGGVALVDGWARNFTSNPIFIALIFTAIIGLVSDLLSTPLDVYDTFVLEQKYGFNTTTYRTFILDKLKGLLLGGIIGGGLLAAFIWFCQIAGSWFWLWAWLAFSAFSLFMTYFYSNIIVPIFNKQEPLEAGSLREAIETFCQKADFPLDNVYVINGSKRSTRANAYFTGFGKRKRIVLYDTLREQLTENEIVAVLAHEVGHYKRKHVKMGMVSSFIQMGASLFILSLFINQPVFHEALGVNLPAIHVGLLSFGILYTPVSMILGLIGNHYSRKHEFQADAFAVSFNLSDNLISGLKKLSSNNLSNLTPHPVFVFFHYSHPPLLERIKAMEKIAANR